MLLYHLTPVKNLNGILARGILPKARGQGLTCSSARMFRRDRMVYLTDQPEQVRKEMAGIDWFETHRPVLLTVKVDPERIGFMHGYEYLHDGPVAIDQILDWREYTWE
jgi:RNA:NAD 2'-phosphotransferase (TPT1/KptA family)